MIVKVAEQRKIYFIMFARDSKSNHLKIFFKRVLKTDTRSCPLLVPPPLFNVEISSVLNGWPMENCYATFAGDSSVESRPTLIRGKGNLVVFKITLCPST